MYSPDDLHFIDRFHPQLTSLAGLLTLVRTAQVDLPHADLTAAALDHLARLSTEALATFESWASTAPQEDLS